MKIGILLADELRTELQSEFGDYANMFQRLLAFDELQFQSFNIRDNDYPKTIDACDAYLITGSRHGVYDKLAWQELLFAYIRTLHAAKKPLLGVCFGHQAIAQALGGEVCKSDKGWGVGLQYWRVVNATAWMQPPLDYLRLLASHQDQVLTLPPQACLLASSDFCENAAFSVGQHVFCVQGHPEFSVDFMRALLEYRREDLSPETMQFAIDAAAMQNDNAVCAAWMRAFFAQAVQ